MPATVKKFGPGIAAIMKDLARVKKSEVFIGIPADKTQRKSDDINNASLLFIHTHGSPINNIPERPVLEPAVAANKAVIAQPLGSAAQAVFAGDANKAARNLDRAGVVASNAAKRWFTDPRNGWEPNAPSTVAQKGSSRPLIDTGELRRSITWVRTQK